MAPGEHPDGEDTEITEDERRLLDEIARDHGDRPFTSVYERHCPLDEADEA